MGTLAHGLHNEKAFKFLLTDIEFIDWIITTAFYSTIHIVDNKLFPFTEAKGANTTKFKTLDKYFYYYKQQNPGWKGSKHELRQMLVRDKLHGDVYADFSWLKDNCWTARYIDYTFPNPNLYKARAEASLACVKQHCI